MVREGASGGTTHHESRIEPRPPIATSRPDLPTYRPADDRRARGYRVANALSYILNPLVLPPFAFALVERHFGATWGQAALTFGVSLTFFCLVPLLYIAGLIRSGRVSSLEVRDRAQRTGPLVVSIASYAVGAALLWWVVEGPARVPILTFAACFPVNTVGLLLINARFKISLHMSSLAGFVGILLFVALTVWRGLPPDLELGLTLATAGPLVILLPMLMWARVRVGAHTPAQVLAGAAFGLFVPLLELWVVVYVWLDLAG